MGFLTSLARWFGVAEPIVARTPVPFGPTAAASARLARIGADVVVEEIGDGYRVRVAERSEPGLRADDPRRLAGLVLDADDDRFVLRAPFEWSAEETPNPDGRAYAVDRLLVEGRPRFFVAGQAASGLAGRLLAIEGAASVLLRGNTLTIERVPGMPWGPIDRAVESSLREHFLSCCGPLAEAAEPSREGLEARVWEVLEERVVPGIHRDGGDIELIGVEDGVVRVHLVGACRSCPAASTTLRMGVEVALRQAFPEERLRVEQV